MSRICRWRYTPGCANALISLSDTCLRNFTCTCVKLGDCLTACGLEECFNSCRPWSHWSETCSFVFTGERVHRNRSRICLCDENDPTYPQRNINDTCWQYSTCETRWELYRLVLFIFACFVIINLVTLLGVSILAYLNPPLAERDIPPFNVTLAESTTGMAEDVSIPEEWLLEKS